jgi:hypothetical protein
MVNEGDRPQIETGKPEVAKSSESVIKTNSPKELENRLSYVDVTIYGAGGNVAERYAKGKGLLGFKGRLYDPMKPPVAGEKDKIVGYEEIDPTLPYMDFTPSFLHARRVVGELAKDEKKRASGAYIEKPCAISASDLEKLDEAIKQNPDYPIFFADHYYYKHLALFALMGVKDIPFKGHIKVTEDPTGRLQEVIDSGQSIIGEAASIEGSLVEGQGNVIDQSGVAHLNAGTTEHRKWLGVRESGGGMLLDLLVHLNNGAQVMGYEMDTVDSVFLGKHTDLAGKYDPIENGDHKTAEDYAEVIGTTKDGVKIKFRVGKFAEKNEKYMLIKGKNGSSIRVDYSGTNTVTVMDKDGAVVGKAEISSDPFTLAEAHGLEHITKGKGAYFYKEQSNSGWLIDKIQKKVRGESDDPSISVENLPNVVSASEVAKIDEDFIKAPEKPTEKV